MGKKTAECRNRENRAKRMGQTSRHRRKTGKQLSLATQKKRETEWDKLQAQEKEKKNG